MSHDLSSTTMTIKKFKNINLKGFKLIVGSASIGNAGQLTCDLLIESLKLEKYGMMHSDANFISILGGPSFEHCDDISTAAEFFISHSLKLIILQIRSPVINESYERLSLEIVNFVKDEGIDELIILSSTLSFEQHNIDKNPYEFVKNEKISENPSLLKLFSTSSAIDKKIPGCGFALQLFETSTQNDIAAIILYKYTSEGDNRPDAHGLLLRVNEYLNKPITESCEIREPISWKFLFGCNINPELY